MKQGSQKDLTLYHYWRSSSSWRVRWGMKIKGIKWHDVPVNLLAEAQKSPDYLKVNPAGFVPAIEVGGRCFGESLAILEWLEETHPAPPLLPADPMDRMQVRQLAFQIACNTQPVQNLSVMRLHSADKEEQQKWARHWITTGLAGYENLLLHGRPGKFSFGDHVTMADLCLVPQIYNARRFNIDVSRWPLLDGIGQRCMELPECKAAHPDKQPGAQLLA
jgi:maleylacetoacetate isomerase